MSTGRPGKASTEINVTPLIDVLLVLLVIFLVAMPIVMRKETLEVPPTTPDVSSTEPVVQVAEHADLTYTIDDGAPIAASDLPRALAPHLVVAHAVFVGFDDGLPWREVVGTIDHVTAMDGVEHVALKTKD
nr:biopolymer transporter ExbD [Kofleriaceae bacterium]